LDKEVKEKRLTVCSICDEVFNKIGLEEKLVKANVCSKDCLKKKEKK
jgi:hypothetical protein